MSKGRVLRHGRAATVLDASRDLLGRRGPAVRAHFASCARCRESVRLWKSFAGLTPRLREAEPPEDAVGKAKALALVPPPVTALTEMKKALRYESLWVPPAAAGARGDAPDQAIYQAEEFAVDLRVTRERSHVTILGQITNVRRPARRLAHVRVALVSGDRVVVRALSNDRGEFHVEHREDDRMWIEVVPEEGRLIRIPVRPTQMGS